MLKSPFSLLGILPILFGISSGVCKAQIATDGSVNTQVNSADQRSFRINGGQQVGRNLFHSFDTFSVPTNGSALFNHQADINNIIGRVTGATTSNIDGIIEAQGNANLFLLNPNGIIFGPNARLDIGGSFLASTADTIQFDDGQEFSALNTQEPPLLAINMPLGLQVGNTPEPVRVLGSRLVVNRGQSLLLAGGAIGIRSAIRQDVGRDIRSDARLIARGGRVELSALATAGDVELTRTGGFKTSSAPRKADIRLSGSLVDVAGGGGGHIKFDARDIEIADFSTLKSGIAQDQGSLGAQAGNIILQATDSISILRDSTVENRVGGEPLDELRGPQAIGNGGDIHLSSKTLQIKNRSQINVDNSGEGNTGLVTVEAKDFVLLETADDRNGIFSNVNAPAIGNTGDVVIETGDLIINNRGRIASSSFGEGDAGKVIIRARNSVALDGGDTDIFSNVNLSIISESGDAVVGNSGGLDIETGSLIVKRGGRIESSVRADEDVLAVNGEGSTGLIRIVARDSIVLEGQNDGDRPTGSGIFSVVQSGTTGTQNLGLQIETGSLTIRNGGRIRADTLGNGNGGDIDIRATDFIVLDGSEPNIDLTEDSNVISSAVRLDRQGNLAQGNAGTINIETGRLSLLNGGRVITSTEGAGDAGQVTIQAKESILLDGTDAKDQPSGVISIAGRGTFTVEGEDMLADPSTGNSGGIELMTPSLLLANGAEISANTVEDSIGEGGNILVNAETLAVRDGAQVTVSSEGSGQGGDITLNANILTLEQGTISAETIDSFGGNINLTLGDLLFLRDNSQISTDALGNQARGDGGNIVIDTPVLVALPDTNSDIRAGAVEGQGGEISLITSGLFGIAERAQSPVTNDITADSEVGLDGLVEVETSDVDRTDNLVKLPASLLNITLTRGCQPKGQSKFVDSRQGGYALSPAEIGTLSSSSWEDLRPFSSTSPELDRSTTSNRTSASELSLVEAQGWSETPNGTITLVVETPQVTASRFTQSPVTCRS